MREGEAPGTGAFALCAKQEAEGLLAPSRGGGGRRKDAEWADLMGG